MIYKRKFCTKKLQDIKIFLKILKYKRGFPCGKALEKWDVKPDGTEALVPALELYAIVINVPKGKLITFYEICSQIVKKHYVRFFCSLALGIFINIAVHSVEESKEKGEKYFVMNYENYLLKGN